MCLKADSVFSKPKLEKYLFNGHLKGVLVDREKEKANFVSLYLYLYLHSLLYLCCICVAFVFAFVELKSVFAVGGGERQTISLWAAEWPHTSLAPLTNHSSHLARDTNTNCLEYKYKLLGIQIQIARNTNTNCSGYKYRLLGIQIQIDWNTNTNGRTPHWSNHSSAVRFWERMCATKFPYNPKVPKFPGNPKDS